MYEIDQVHSFHEVNVPCQNGGIFLIVKTESKYSPQSPVLHVLMKTDFFFILTGVMFN